MAASPLLESGSPCAESCACGCHAGPIRRIEAVGMSWHGLTPTELALLAALLPVGTLRPRGWLLEHLRPGRTWATESNAKHFLNINACRLRLKIQKQGWTVTPVFDTGLLVERWQGPPPPMPAKEPPKSRQFSATTRALAAGLCPLRACGIALQGHQRCGRCEFLVGPHHTLQTVNNAGLCQWCSPQRQQLQHIAEGLRDGDRVRAQVQA